MNNDFPRGAEVSRPYEKNSYFLHKNCLLEEVYSICEVFTRKGKRKDGASRLTFAANLLYLNRQGLFAVGAHIACGLVGDGYRPHSMNGQKWNLPPPRRRLSFLKYHSACLLQGYSFKTHSEHIEHSAILL